MKILVINNDGGGFADYVDVADGTTVAQLFERQIGSTKPSHYLIRVNRQPCPADQVLCEGDRISITPTKIEGANSYFHAVRAPPSLSARWRRGWWPPGVMNYDATTTVAHADGDRNP